MFKHLFFLLLSLIALKLPAQDSLLIKADQHLYDSVLNLSRPARLAALPYFTGQIAKRRKSGKFTLPLTKSYYLAATANLTEAAYLNALSYIDTNIMLIKLDTTNFSQNRLAYSQYVKGATYQGIGTLKLALDFGEKAVANLKSALEQGDSLYTAYEYGYILEFAGRMAYQNGDFPLAYHRLSQVDELMKTAYVARTESQAKMTRASALLQEEKIEEATRILLKLQDYPFAKQSL